MRYFFICFYLCIACSLYSSHLQDEYHYFFDSSIYDSYHEQRSSFSQKTFNQLQALKRDNLHCDDPLVSQTVSFAELLKSSICSFSPAEKRGFQQKVIVHLREINQCIKEKGYDKQKVMKPAIFQAIEYVEQINHWIFTQPYLIPSCQTFLEDQSILQEGNLAVRSLTDEIRYQYDLLNKKDHFGGHRSWPEEMIKDPLALGFLPSTLFKAFSTQFIWIPRQTVSGKKSSLVAINSEFLNYLSDLKAQGKKHLYINLMKREGGEKSLSNALENLSNDPGYKGVVTVVTLDKSSEFYWQKGKYGQTEAFDHFKELFINQLFYQSHPQYHWPKDLSSDWKRVCKEIIDSTHAYFFKGKSELTRQEKMVFIELVYIRMIEALSYYYKPAYTNVSCKYSMDRGPSLWVGIYVYNLKINQAYQPISLAEKKMILTMLFAPPLLAHNRPPRDHRVERIVELVDFLFNHSASSQEKLFEPFFFFNDLPFKMAQ